MITVKAVLLLSELNFVAGLKLPTRGTVKTDDIGKKLPKAIFVQFVGNVAHLLSTDGAAVSRSRVPVFNESSEFLSFALPSDRAIVNPSSLGDDLTLEVANNDVSISHSQGQITLGSWVDVKDYVAIPAPPENDESGAWELPASTLSWLLHTAARFAATKNLCTFHTEGVILKAANSTVRAYAGDGHRLLDIQAGNTPHTGSETVFVPKTYTGLIGNITPNPSDVVTISQGGGWTKFECPPRSVIFPEPVGPLHPPIEVAKSKFIHVPVAEVDAAALKAAVQNARRTIRDWSRKIIFTCTSSDAITIAVEHPDLMMQTREQVPAIAKPGASFR